MDSVELILRDEAATARWAAALADALAMEPLTEQPFVVHLSGDLGAGKTALARAILRRLGFSGAVKSPTFTLVEPYNLPNFSVYHFDLYRFSSGDQWFDAGFDDILDGPGLMLLEWPEKAAGAIGMPDLLLELVAPGDDDRRRLHARAFTDGGRRCLSRLASPPAMPPATGRDASS
jgi:tRNA threonylcarbamoyladenosine biosynthesis protein TsaE